MPANQLTLTCVLAHPDDESMGTGGLLAKCKAEDIRTTLVTATGGQRGWFGEPEEHPGLEALAKIRHEELLQAGNKLGVAQIDELGFMDGELDQVRPTDVIKPIVEHLRRERPHVVVTFDPFGIYGHPDHIAISQLALASVVAAADTGSFRQAGPAHQVKKFYYFIDTLEAIKLYEKAFGELVVEMDGDMRKSVGWPDWAITARIDTSDYIDQIWQAIQCHQSQLPNIQSITKLSKAERFQLWSAGHFYRSFSLVNGGRQLETDLFEGLR